jgi:hypothetical protein
MITHYFYEDWDWHKMDDAWVQQCLQKDAGCWDFGVDWARVDGPDTPDWDGYWTRIDGANDADGDGICDITLPADNLPPIADAGDDQSVRYLGEEVDLDGTLSHDDNTAPGSLLYQWSFTSYPGSTAPAFSDPSSATTSFTANDAGTYIIELQVTDEAGLSDADSVEVSTANLAPTAEAGDNVLEFVGYSLSLDGSLSSDPENYPLAFAWTMSEKPDGSSATLMLGDTAYPYFTPDLEGLYKADLIVSDDLGPSLPDSVEITAVLPETFAEGEIVKTAELVAELSNTQVTTRGNQRAFLNFLSQALLAIQIGDTEEAIKKLEDAISRTDGCAIHGAPDGNGKGRDWITDCEAQGPAYVQLTAALDAISLVP